MNITCIVFGIIFLITGVLFALGLLHRYLNAWKKMPDEEKEKIDIKALCINIGISIAVSGIIFLIGGFVKVFRDHYFALTMIVWLVFAGCDVYYISKSRRYIKK